MMLFTVGGRTNENDGLFWRRRRGSQLAEVLAEGWQHGKTHNAWRLWPYHTVDEALGDRIKAILKGHW